MIVLSESAMQSDDTVRHDGDAVQPVVLKLTAQEQEGVLYATTPL